MRALIDQGAMDASVQTVPDPVLLADDDLILRVAATAICGSDLHRYCGKVAGLKEGDVLGHEFMSVVEEVGSAVNAIAPGDPVLVP